jgi:hypothetical protein
MCIDEKDDKESKNCVFDSYGRLLPFHPFLSLSFLLFLLQQTNGEAAVSPSTPYLSVLLAF